MWDKEGWLDESKSNSLHVMHPAATATYRVVERSHFQALGREIVASICHCCSVVVLCMQGRARCNNYHAQPVASRWTGGACLVIWPMCTGGDRWRRVALDTAALHCCPYYACWKWLRMTRLVAPEWAAGCPSTVSRGMAIRFRACNGRLCRRPGPLLVPSLPSSHPVNPRPVLIKGNRYVCVALFIKPILGNQCTVQGFLHDRAKGERTHDWKSPTHHLTLTVCCLVLLNQYWGIVTYGPWASSWASQGRRTHDPRSPTSQPQPVPP